MRQNQKLKDRLDLALTIIRDSPQPLSATELAERLETSKNYALVIIRALERRGDLKRQKDSKGNAVPFSIKIISRKIA